MSSLSKPRFLIIRSVEKLCDCNGKICLDCGEHGICEGEKILDCLDKLGGK